MDKYGIYEITIVVDMNDADYNTQVSNITGEELEKIKPLIEAIKGFKSYQTETEDEMGNFTWTHHHNYPVGEYSPRTDLGEKHPEEIYSQFNEEIHELFREHCPYGEHGFHTVKRIEVTPLVEKTRLL